MNCGGRHEECDDDGDDDKGNDDDDDSKFDPNADERRMRRRS